MPHIKHFYFRNIRTTFLYYNVTIQVCQQQVTVLISSTNDDAMMVMMTTMSCHLYYDMYRTQQIDCTSHEHNQFSCRRQPRHLMLTVLGHSTSFTIRLVNRFLLVLHCYYVSIFYCF